MAGSSRLVALGNAKSVKLIVRTFIRMFSCGMLYHTSIRLAICKALRGALPYAKHYVAP
jgi:hypothetical protein